MSLRQTQQALWRAVRYDPTPADALAHFAGDGRLDAEQRLTIYRKMYWYRQVQALTDAFPQLHSELGDKRFAQLSTDYIREHPSEDPALEKLGRAMPDFMAARMPGLAGVARLEWTQTLALLAPDPEGVCKPNEVDPERFAHGRLGFVPSLHLIEVDARAARLVEPAIRDGADAHHLAVWRRDFGVRSLHLPPLEAECLTRARSGAAVSDVLELYSATEEGIQQAFQMLLSWFARKWIETTQPA